MKKSGLFACCACAAIFALPIFNASAQTQESPAAAAQAGNSVSIHLDPARTTVTFTAGTLHRIRGTFQLKGGIFALDSQTGIAEGEILVDAETEKSNDARLDKKIQGQTLDTSQFPGIVFHPEKVTGELPEKAGQSHLKVSGSFTIHGKDHPLTADILATRSGSQVDMQTVFYIPYVKWGMKDASSFLMRDRDIKVTVDSHGTIEGIHANS